MNKSGSGSSTGGEDENTKYAKDADNTKYASNLENTKYAGVDENTKYAREDENTKYAGVDENTKYAKADENTKYAGGDPTGSRRSSPLQRRRAVDAALEEALMSAAAAVDRIHPGISNETRARLVATLIDKFGSELLEAHLAVARSDHG